MGNQNAHQQPGIVAKNIQSMIQSQQEFEHWKKIGNELAVSSLQNSGKLTLKQLEKQLKQAINYYDQTQNFNVLFQDQGDQNDSSAMEERKKQIEELILAANEQSVNGFNYADEILRIGKNRAVCQRALIQNMYIQIHNDYDKHNHKGIALGLETVTQYIVDFIHNQNYHLRFIVDQLGKDPQTGVIGAKSLANTSQSNKFSNNYNSLGKPNAPGQTGQSTTNSGADAATKHKKSLHEANVDSAQPQFHRASGDGSRDSEPSGKGIGYESRFIEILQGSQFLFDDKFLKNLTEPDPNFNKKIQMYEHLYYQVSHDNYELVRKLSWTISKAFYKKSIISQNIANHLAALKEINSAQDYFMQFAEYTHKLEQCPILEKNNYSAKNPFLKPNQINEYRLKILNQKVMLQNKPPDGSGNATDAYQGTFCASPTSNRGGDISNVASKDNSELNMSGSQNYATAINHSYAPKMGKRLQNDSQLSSGGAPGTIQSNKMRTFNTLNKDGDHSQSPQKYQFCNQFSPITQPRTLRGEFGADKKNQYLSHASPDPVRPGNAVQNRPVDPAGPFMKKAKSQMIQYNEISNYNAKKNTNAMDNKITEEPKSSIEISTPVFNKDLKEDVGSNIQSSEFSSEREFQKKKLSFYNNHYSKKSVANIQPQRININQIKYEAQLNKTPRASHQTLFTQQQKLQDFYKSQTSQHLNIQNVPQVSKQKPNIKNIQANSTGKMKDHLMFSPKGEKSKKQKKEKAKNKLNGGNDSIAEMEEKSITSMDIHKSSPTKPYHMPPKKRSHVVTKNYPSARHERGRDVVEFPSNNLSGNAATEQNQDSQYDNDSRKLSYNKQFQALSPTNSAYAYNVNRKNSCSNRFSPRAGSEHHGPLQQSYRPKFKTKVFDIAKARKLSSISVTNPPRQSPGFMRFGLTRPKASQTQQQVQQAVKKIDYKVQQDDLYHNIKSSEQASISQDQNSKISKDKKSKQFNKHQASELSDDIRTYSNSSKHIKFKPAVPTVQKDTQSKGGNLHINIQALQADDSKEAYSQRLRGDSQSNQVTSPQTAQTDREATIQNNRRIYQQVLQKNYNINALLSNRKAPRNNSKQDRMTTLQDIEGKSKGTRFKRRNASQNYTPRAVNYKSAQNESTSTSRRPSAQLPVKIINNTAKEVQRIRKQSGVQESENVQPIQVLQTKGTKIKNNLHYKDIDNRINRLQDKIENMENKYASKQEEPPSPQLKKPKAKSKVANEDTQVDQIADQKEQQPQQPQQQPQQPPPEPVPVPAPPADKPKPAPDARRPRSIKAIAAQKPARPVEVQDLAMSTNVTTPLVGEKDFLPLKKLGRGSFGDVYLVRKKDTGELYAMKTLCKRNGLEEIWLTYVRTERYVLAEIDSPFIVKLRYAFQTDKKLFLVIDFCPGGDLESLINSGKNPLSEDQAKFYIAEIVLAIKELHSHNIIYRDLKPDNVVIDNDGHVKLIDFGMAKTNILETARGASTFCGSVKYLAPEMLKKIGHGKALDWYLLGVLLYEVLVGVTPYFSKNRDELFNNIINEIQTKDSASQRAGKTEEPKLWHIPSSPTSTGTPQTRERQPETSLQNSQSARLHYTKRHLNLRGGQ